MKLNSFSLTPRRSKKGNLRMIHENFKNIFLKKRMNKETIILTPQGELMIVFACSLQTLLFKPNCKASQTKVRISTKTKLIIYLYQNRNCSLRHSKINLQQHLFCPKRIKVGKVLTVHLERYLPFELPLNNSL